MSDRGGNRSLITKVASHPVKGLHILSKPRTDRLSIKDRAVNIPGLALGCLGCDFPAPPLQGENSHRPHVSKPAWPGSSHLHTQVQGVSQTGSRGLSLTRCSRPEVVNYRPSGQFCPSDFCSVMYFLVNVKR